MHDQQKRPERAADGRTAPGVPDTSGRVLSPPPPYARRAHRVLTSKPAAPMIDIEGLKAICAYCLMSADGTRSGAGAPNLMEEINPPEGIHPHVNSAAELVSRFDGHRLFRFFDSGPTTCTPVTVVNGTWVCALHVRDSVMAWDRRWFG